MKITYFDDNKDEIKVSVDENTFKFTQLEINSNGEEIIIHLSVDETAKLSHSLKLAWDKINQKNGSSFQS